MIEGNQVVAIIPARGGSKGVPRKNVRDVGGKPLIAWTIEEAKQSRYIDRLIVSTDDEEIATVATSYGCESIKRPEELSQDDTPTIDAVFHALARMDSYDYVVLLQPTSPLRVTEDIDRCLEICMENDVHSCVSICETETSPYWMYRLNEDKRLSKLVQSEKRYTRRQDTPKVYALNGAVYVANIQWLIRERSFVADDTVGYIMPRERSLDIDTPLDLEFVDFLMRQRALSE